MSPRRTLSLPAGLQRLQPVDHAARGAGQALLSKHIYRHLSLSGYARLDYRMTNGGEFYLLEANPNPQIAQNEDFADSAAHSGLSYGQLLQKIITLGLSYNAAEYVII